MNLRDYQLEAKDAVFRCLLGEGRRSCLVVAPTGTGKTVLFAAVAAGWPEGKVMVIAHRRILLEQAAEKIGPAVGETPLLEAGAARAGGAHLFDAKVVVASKDSLHERRIGKFDPADFGLVIVDEAHRCAAKNRTYGRILDHFARNPRCKVLGVTATPDRTDNAALVGDGRPFEVVAYQYPLWEECGPSALEDGWLVRPVQGYAVCEGLSLADCKLRDGDFSDADLERIFAEEEMLHRTAIPLVEKAGARPTVVFCATVAHAAGYEKDGEHVPGLVNVLDRYAPGRCRAVHGKMTEEQRAYELQMFREGKTQFLCSCDLLIEGFDETSVACVAICRPTKSRSRYAQMVGRGLRPLSSCVPALNAAGSAAARRAVIAASGKPDCLVIDVVGLGDLQLVVNLADVFEQAEDHPAVKAAKRRAAESQGSTDMAKALLDAKARLWSEAADDLLSRRRQLVAKGSVSWEQTDPLAGHGASPALTKAKAAKEPATDKQVAFLVNLGCGPDTARSYSKRQAGAVITQLKQRTCTRGQAKLLRRAGMDPSGFNFFEASAAIDKLQANGWRVVG